MKKLETSILKTVQTKILYILLICSMTVIFVFSSQEAATSNNLSKVVTQKIAFVTVKNYKELPSNQQIMIVKELNHFIRKIAHFFNFLILGFLLIALCKKKGFNIKKRVSISAIVGVLYAVSDEIHQNFVPGRGAQFKDVIIDFAGVILGILTFEMLIKMSDKSSDRG